jgi:hypothetical protein
MTLNKKKSAKSVSLMRPGQFSTLSWLSNLRSAKEAARTAGTLFSVKPATPVGLQPEEPLASEVQGLLNSVTNVIECATGGHGRCADSACGCRCHKSRARSRAKRRMSV